MGWTAYENATNHGVVAFFVSDHATAQRRNSDPFDGPNLRSAMCFRSSLDGIKQ